MKKSAFSQEILSMTPLLERYILKTNRNEKMNIPCSNLDRTQFKHHFKDFLKKIMQ